MFTYTPTNSTEDLKGLKPSQIDDIAKLKGPKRGPYASQEDFALAILISVARRDRERRRQRREGNARIRNGLV